MTQPTEPDQTQEPASRPVQLVLPAPRNGAGPDAGATRSRRNTAAGVLDPNGPHWRRYGPLWGSLAGASGAIAATGAIGALPPPLTAAGVVSAAAGGVLSGAVRDMPGRRIVWRGVCWLSAGCWAAWSAVTTPWGSWQLGSLAVATLTAGWVSAAGEHRRRRDAIASAQRAADTAAAEHAAGPAREWTARIARVCEIDVTITSVDQWPTGDGYTVVLRLPAGGKTFQDLASRVVSLATDADLPTGCEVTFRRGGTRREVFLDVTTVPGSLEQVRHLPDVTRRTVNDDVDIGVLRSGAPALINVRYHCVALAGQTDAGKSNQLQVLNAMLAQCDDVVLWHIDLTGGNLSRAWIRPWYRREPGYGHPVIDSVAADERQAEAMLTAALAIIDGRRSQYDHVMEEAGDDKIPVSAGLPELVIVVDEIHRLPAHLRKMLVDISDTGRGAGVRTISCGLRAVETYLPGAIVAQARVRIGMRVSDEKETAYLFGWREKIDPSSMPYQGCGMLFQGEAGSESLVPFRGYRIAPPRIAEVAAAVQDWRPGLDELSVWLANQATGGAYDRRWAESLPLLFGTTTPTPGGDPPVSTPTSGDSGKTRRQRDAEAFVDKIFGMPSEERDRRLREELDDAARRGEEHRRDAEADRAAVELSMSGLGISSDDRLLALVDDAGPGGIATKDLEDIAAQHGIGSRATVYRILKRLTDKRDVLRADGRATAARFGPGGERAGNA